MSMSGRRVRAMTAADLSLMPPACAALARRPGWPQAVQSRWAVCGMVAGPDDAPFGWLTLDTVGDVAELTAIAVSESHRRQGVGRHLVQATAALLVRRDVTVLEADGGYGPSAPLPVAFLEKVGFRVVRPHPVRPRLRMDLHTTLRWKPSLSAAWSRLSGLVGQPSSPEPATYARREVTQPTVSHS